jgi:hypothetical protein
MEVFEECRAINNMLLASDEVGARNSLIKLLDYHKTNNIEYSPLVNALIRETGLYPYMQASSAAWQERYVFEVFKTNIGLEKPITLHREQANLLKRLISGESIAVSAPTSFGKSFVIDAFISIRKPKNVAIIVPTIALTDETRRRLYKKFANHYKIITTSDVALAERNIFIFPQERAINYINTIDSLDILIIDEFYKADKDFEADRSPALLKAILKLGAKSKQKYFLAPNISALNENPFTRGVSFHKLDFNTVFLEKHELYRDIDGNEKLKSAKLIEILNSKRTKTLIYAGTYSEITKVSNLLIENRGSENSNLLNDFTFWLEKHYQPNWQLVSLAKRGVGVHNGRLHRSLSQIQVRLFEEDAGINTMISTSSIIEGVNTSTENVVLWRNLSGKNRWATINDFTYKNIIGRGGRMLKHFIGKIYILEAPPADENTQLNLTFPDELVGDIDVEEYKNDLTKEQITQILSYKREISQLIGVEAFERLQKENAFHLTNGGLILSIAKDMVQNKQAWNGLAYLNSDDVEQWDWLLYKIIRLQPGKWETTYTAFVAFVKALSRNWYSSIPEILRSLYQHNIDIDAFFKLERNATFKLSALLHDLNVLQKEILTDNPVDISPFISKVSHAFLPSVVYQLEEYGLPRMISKKIQKSKIIDFNREDLTIHEAIEIFNKIGLYKVRSATEGLDDFDHFILDYFFDGITTLQKQ